MDKIEIVNKAMRDQAGFEWVRIPWWKRWWWKVCAAWDCLRGRQIGT